MYETKQYFKKIKNNVSCRLCPNNCLIPQGEFGKCKARKNINGRLFSMTYGHPCSINLDPIEKKPLFHFMPGKMILSLGTFGCNLFCKGCQNFDISRQSASEDMDFVSPKEIIDLAKAHNIKMIAYTYNEPTVFYEYMLDIAKLARKEGIKNVIVSNGYINAEPLRELCKYIDAANIDLKGIREDFYKDYCDVRMQPILETIKYIHDQGIWLELTNLVIPDKNDGPKDIESLCDWIVQNIGKDVPLHFSRFYPYYEAKKIRPTPQETLILAKEIAAKKGINYVYIGNLGFQENTFCKTCNAILIDRKDSPKKTNMTKNVCMNCKTVLPGVF